MDFKNAREVEQLVWEMRLADYPRATNRTRINDLFNGNPPYSAEEETANSITVNVNPLGGTKLAHDARRQFYSAFLKPGKFFHARCDMGAAHKRADYSTTATTAVNKIMKRSPIYFETQRSKFALNVLHGIGPANWEDRFAWCPDAIGVEDILLPSNTLLTMKNVPFFAIYRSYTGAQLRRLTSGPKVDAAWNKPMIEKLIAWIDAEGSKLNSSVWPEVWSPEKQAERIKGDGGLYASDRIPTIDCYDFYFWNDADDVSGWNRRIVLDMWGVPGVGGVAAGPTKKYGEDNKGFLYNPGKRKYAEKLSQIVSFQFADLSAVSPFRYHSVRSLGFVLWAVCHLQNRLYCKIQEATLESLMQYFRVKSMEDVERALKVELIGRGFIDESIQMIPQAERWQTNIQLAEFAYGQNQQHISENSSSYIQRQDYGDQGKERKTKFQVMAEVNATTALVSAGLMQAYQYQTFEDQEIFRRFLIPESRDPEVREFRLTMLKSGVPEKCLCPEAWEVTNEQVMGAGNKTMEMTIAQQLLEMMPKYDPPAQRKILHDVTLAITDDAAMAAELVPEKKVKITDTIHDSQGAVATLMMGLPYSPYPGQNHIEATETWIGELAMILHQLAQLGTMPDQGKILGMQNMLKHISEQMQILAQDKDQAPRVKKYSQELAQLTQLVAQQAKALAQAQPGLQAQQGLDPKDQAKIQATLISAKAKADNTRESHGERTAQKQIQFEQQQRQKDEAHKAKMEQEAQAHSAALQQEQEAHQLELQKEAQAHRLEMEQQLHSTAVEEAATNIRTAEEVKRIKKKAKKETE